jgi:Arylsulfatase regulator (Fe-S oxidoreductase)
VSKVYDIKLGYSCNNHCLHCVIEPNVRHLERIGEKIDSSYGEIIECLNSSEFKAADSVVITGGEPTLRKEFIRIIKYISINFPEKVIIVQTNGRLLNRHLAELKKISNKIQYVVAVHGTEEVHNLVTGNRGGNPFRETWESLRKIKEVYGDFNSVARIEIVWSSYNIEDTVKCTRMLFENGFTSIGYSYPHMDGKYENDSSEARRLGFPYSKLLPILEQLYDLSVEYSQSRLTFEEVPLCMFRRQSGQKLAISNKFTSIGHNRASATVKFPGMKLTNFDSEFARMHRKVPECSRCRYDSSCLGVWYEAVALYGSEGFLPVLD